MSQEECEEGEEPCHIWQEQREEERQVVRAEIIRKWDKEEYNDSGVVLEPSRGEASSEVSFDQGFQYEREREYPGAISAADELQFDLQERQREWTQHIVISQRRKEVWEVQRLEEYLGRWMLQCRLCTS
jgi:hypothetical protein